jgi:hypothetical protein
LRNRAGICFLVAAERPRTSVDRFNNNAIADWSTMSGNAGFINTASAPACCARSKLGRTIFPGHDQNGHTARRWVEPQQLAQRNSIDE